MKMNKSNCEKAEMLVEVLPYANRFRDKIIVIKYGGNAMINEDLKKAVMQDLLLMKSVGMHPILVHGGGPAINDLMAGHANVSFQNLGAIATHVKSGKLKALGVTSSQRNPTLPEVPTMGESGVKDLEVYSWQAAAAPKGLPPAVRAKLEAELAASAQAPGIKPQFEAIGFEVVATNGEQFKKFLTDEIARWKTVIDTGKITAE